VKGKSLLSTLLLAVLVVALLTPAAEVVAPPPPVNLTEVVSTESTNDSYWASLAVDSTGKVHVAWADLTDYLGCGPDCDIFYKCYSPAIGGWTTTKVVSTESTDDSFSPSLAVDSTGKVHIAWEDKTDWAGSGTDYDIFYKWLPPPPTPTVGGVWVPVDKFGLLAPYIGLASTILVATVATAIYVKHVKRRKEKQ